MDEENNDPYFERCEYCNTEFKPEDKTFCQICTRELRNEVYGSTDEFHLSDEELSQMYTTIHGHWCDNRVIISSCSKCCDYCCECNKMLCNRCTGQNIASIVKTNGLESMICGFCTTKKAVIGSAKLNVLLNKALVRAVPNVYKPIEGPMYTILKDKWKEYTDES